MKEEEIADPTAEKDERTETPTYAHSEEKIEHLPDVEDRSRGHLNAVFENPLAGIPREQLFKDVADFCHKYDLMDHVETFKKGALISQDPAKATSLPELTDDERVALEREHTHKWSQPWQLYFLACMSLKITLPTDRTNFSTSSYVLSCCRRPRYGRNSQQRCTGYIHETRCMCFRIHSNCAG